ncbi:hypothetical protein OPQ81_001568 [Rhizoctonia solani]|nr:hypothetical protein OPQ81_001568 [Rhizoctonia solani]
MSDSDISTSTRSSRSRTSTSRSRSGSSSTFRSTASTSQFGTETFIPTNKPSATGLLTASVPVQTETTSSLVAPTSTPASNTADNSGGPKPPVAVIAVSTILGVLVIGAVAFFLIFRCRRRRGGSPYITRHESRRRDTHPQPTIQDSLLYLPSKEPENEKDSSPMSPSSSSIDSDILRSPKSRVRSSRASSSIFIDDRDDVTISSRSNYFRPLSLGESLTSRGLQSPPSATTQHTPLFDRFNSNRLGLERQLPTIPGTPATPRFAFFGAEEQDGKSLMARAQPTQPPQAITLSRTTTRNSTRSSYSSRSKTRNSTPPTPTLALPPLSPPPLMPLPPLPNSSDDLSKRQSTNTLTAPSRFELGDSRPVSMQSAYSAQSQNLSPSYSGALSPDVLATLERLKKRISTPWSINSVDTDNFNKTTTAPTEEGSPSLPCLLPGTLYKISGLVLSHTLLFTNGRDNEAETFVLGDSDDEEDSRPSPKRVEPDAVDTRSSTPLKVPETSESSNVPKPAPPQSSIYYIKPRDTVNGIALKYGVDPRLLCQLNKLSTSTMTTTPHLLHTRTTLQLPQGARAPSPPPPDLQQRLEARARERAGKAFQAITKETDWGVAQTETDIGR